MLETLKQKFGQFGRVSPQKVQLSKSAVAPILQPQDSNLEYHLPRQTLIILDWDDSLCPSHFIRANRPVLNYFQPCPEIPKFKQPLAELSALVVRFLRAAKELGTVVIVTNAQAGWVETSCRNFLPEVLETIEALAIDVVYARSTVEFPERLMPQSWKEKAMKDAVGRFYSQYLHQSWKNVVSVGDQTCDRDALKVVTHARPTPKKRCRTKTVKLRDEPTVADLIEQLHTLMRWIQPLVHLDRTVDIDLSENDHEKLDMLFDQKLENSDSARLAQS